MFRELAHCHKFENYRKIYLKIVCEFAPRSLSNTRSQPAAVATRYFPFFSNVLEPAALCLALWAIKIIINCITHSNKDETFTKSAKCFQARCLIE